MPNRKNKEEFIIDARKVHGGKYNYDKVNYVNNRTKVCIICPEHGEFWQIPDSHLRGRGCPVCRYIKSTKKIREKQGLTKEIFVKRANEIHGNKYDYSKSDYKNNETKTCIICPEHGEFYQTPHHHLSGSGCPICGRNDISEKKLLDVIKKEFSNVIYQYKVDFLRNKKPLSIDIFLPDYNVAIEYQGRQHFIPISRFGGFTEFQKIKERDKIKYELCKKNNIQLLYFSNESTKLFENYFDKVFTNEDELINEIKSNSNGNRL